MIVEQPGCAPHLFEASQLATKSVIVYSDRAEVKRLVTVDLPKGNQEIIIQVGTRNCKEIEKKSFKKNIVVSKFL